MGMDARTSAREVTSADCGGIYVKKPKGSNWSWGKDQDERVKVSICSTCVVDGELRFERAVELRVESGAKIGQVIGDDVLRR